MKKSKKGLIYIGVSVLIGLGIGWLIKPNNASDSHADHSESIDSQKETIWTCSMHPQIRKQEPGKCPICGMELIPANENSQNEDPLAINMSATAVALANIESMVVEKGKAIKKIQLNGKLKADQRKVYSQTTHFSARIEELQVQFEGEYVKKDQVIAMLYSPDLVSAQEELREAMLVKEDQPALFEAAKNKLKNWKLSQKQIRNIMDADEIIEEFPLRADVSGYVLDKKVNKGDYLKEGEVLFEIADLSVLWALFDIYESDLPWIEEGDEIQFSVSGVPSKIFNGKVTYLDPFIDPKSRVAKARVVVPNSSDRLKPEMFISGTLLAELEKRNDQLLIPKAAVMWTGKRSIVYVKQRSEKGLDFKLREVVLGPEMGESYLIEDGLQGGEEIAVNGTFSIDAAAQLAAKPSMMNRSEEEEKAGSKMMEDQKVNQDLNTKQEIYQLINLYLKLKESLAEDNFEAAKKQSEELFKKLKATPMSSFSGKSHEVWMKSESVIRKQLEKMKESSSLKEVRSHFIVLSDEFITLAKEFGSFEDKLHLQFCPMANENQGAYWLSKEEKIKNPYFGEMMLRCGRVEKVF